MSIGCFRQMFNGGETELRAVAAHNVHENVGRIQEGGTEFFSSAAPRVISLTKLQQARRCFIKKEKDLTCLRQRFRRDLIELLKE